MIKNDVEIMKLLKITEIRHVLAHTNMGELCICLRKDEDKYFFTLDAVEVDKEVNEGLMKIFFPPKIVIENDDKRNKKKSK
jgi:hypothetical protein